MNTTPTQWRLAVHFSYRISQNGGVSTRTPTQSTPISPMRYVTYSQSYHMVLEWRLVILLGKTLSAGGSQSPHPRRLGTTTAKKISVRVEWLCQSRQRHPGGGLLRAKCQDHASRHISPSDRRFAVSSCSVGPPF